MGSKAHLDRSMSKMIEVRVSIRERQLSWKELFYGELVDIMGHASLVPRPMPSFSSLAVRGTGNEARDMHGILGVCICNRMVHRGIWD